MMLGKDKPCKDLITVVLLAASLLVCIGTSALCVALSLRLSALETMLNKKVVESQSQSQNTDQRGKTISCQPCSELTLGPFMEDDTELTSFAKLSQGGILMCCSRTPQENGKLMKLFVQRKIAEETAKCQRNCTQDVEDSSTPSPSGRPRAFAHLLAGLQNNTGQKDLSAGTLSPIKNWLTTRKLTQTRGVSTRNGQIIVRKRGLYMVYSHVQFSDASPPPGGVQTRFYQLTHKVCRYNVIYANGGEECLMEAEVTKHLNQTPTLTRNPSYMLGVFMLERNDKVYVRVTNTSLLSRVPESTFFGVLEMT